MINKKSQSAFESLMTYGWGIVVILAVIAALTYLGVLDIKQFLPNTCILPHGIMCLHHKVDNSGPNGVGIVKVIIKNKIGYDIDEIIVKAEGCGRYPTTDLSTEKLKNEGLATYTITCSTMLTDKRYKAQLNVSYTREDSKLGHNQIGLINTIIE